MNSLKTIAAQLDVARPLLAQPRLDLVEALTMLNGLPPEIRDEAAVHKAREAVSALATGDEWHLTSAHVALRDVVMLLERRMLQAV